MEAALSSFAACGGLAARVRGLASRLALAVRPAGLAKVSRVNGMLRPSEAVVLLLDEWDLPAEGWGRLEFREVRSAAGREWPDDGEVHEARKPEGGPRNAVPLVPIPPELVRLLGAGSFRVYSGTRDIGWLFATYGCTAV